MLPSILGQKKCKFISMLVTCCDDDCDDNYFDGGDGCDYDYY